MRLTTTAALALAAIATPLAIPALFAQSPAQPGVADPSLVKAGTYTVDVNHTQVTWQVNHMNLTMLQGQIGASGGTLVLDPANPSSDKVDVTFDTGQQTVQSEHFRTHLASKDFFDAATFPTARFVSTSVTIKGLKAVIVGNLTIKNMTKPVTLDTTFIGTGINPNSKKPYVGFRATTSIMRSDFGLANTAMPIVSDKVDLVINAGFAL